VKISDFHYDFPPELVATEPSKDSRLLMYERAGGKIQHTQFRELSRLLKPSDCLVVNNTKVIPARFFAQKQTGGKLEGLYIKKTNDGVLVWIKGKVKAGEFIEFEDLGSLKIINKEEMRVDIECDSEKFEAFLWKKGLTPVPPYIRQQRERAGLEETLHDDPQNYQTAFAKDSEFLSVAAPTASLHFDSELLNTLPNELLEIKLQVGEGTFAPVRVEKLSDHEMHTELVQIEAQVWKRLKEIKKEGRRIIAVGTTAVRSLESAYLREEQGLSIEEFETNLFIKPPFHFRMVDGLITNFHWPDSTLIVLVATFMEAQNSRCLESINHDWKKLYEAAIARNYKLFSYGDASLIL